MSSLVDASIRSAQIVDDHWNQYSTKDILALFLDSAQRYNLPLAAWRLPDQDQQHMILDLAGQSSSVNIDLENMPAGFIFSSFESDFSQPDTKAGFIHADLYYESKSRQLKQSKNLNTPAEKAKRLVEAMRQRLQKGFTAADLSFNSNCFSEKAEIPRQNDFINLVDQSIRAIRQGAFKKVVPSRCEFVPLSEKFNPADTFESLCSLYPHAFVSLLAVPELGVWLGASPEILVHTFLQNNARYFRTIALAGTQRLDESNGLRNAAWRIKEIEEQAMVSRYIINCFKKIRLRDFDEDGPKTVAAGNLLHLRTDFTVDMDQVNFPELGSVMLKLLHPTSAVCGLPKETSLHFLKNNESYKRELFAGFLGPVNIKDEVNIFVNLRCMQLIREGALLYAGAGVTADSDPEKEWQETAMKMQTLQQVLK